MFSVQKVKRELLTPEQIKKINDFIDGKTNELPEISLEVYKKLATGNFTNIAALYSLYDPTKYDPKYLNKGNLDPAFKHYLEGMV